MYVKPSNSTNTTNVVFYFYLACICEFILRYSASNPITTLLVYNEYMISFIPKYHNVRCTCTWIWVLWSFYVSIWNYTFQFCFKHIRLIIQYRSIEFEATREITIGYLFQPFAYYLHLNQELNLLLLIGKLE